MTQKICDKAVKRCFLYLVLFSIGKKLKKCVAGLFTKILLCYYIVWIYIKLKNCVMKLLMILRER